MASMSLVTRVYQVRKGGIYRVICQAAAHPQGGTLFGQPTIPRLQHQHLSILTTPHLNLSV